MLIPKSLNINFGIPTKEDLKELKRDNEYLKSLGIKKGLILVVNCPIVLFVMR